MGITLQQPDIGPLEEQAVLRVLRSRWLGAGQVADDFVHAFARVIDVEPSTLRLVPSGSEALFIALDVLDLSPDDEVILPSLSFSAAGQAVCAAGAKVVLCDCSPSTLTAEMEHILDRISPRTRAYIHLHYGGIPQPVADLFATLSARGIVVIEDAACCPTARIGEQACGTLGDIGIWSFDPVKLVTAGEAGMLHLKEVGLRRRLDPRLRLGMNRRPGSRSGSGAEWWGFDVIDRGRKSQVSDIAASLALAQLGRLPAFVARRFEMIALYRSLLGGYPEIILPEEPRPGITPCPYMFWIRLPDGVRDGLAQHLRANDIYTAFYYQPLHRTRRFATSAAFPGTDAAARSTLSLPLHTGLSDDDIRAVATLVGEYAATRAAPGRTDDGAGQ